MATECPDCRPDPNARVCDRTRAEISSSFYAIVTRAWSAVAREFLSREAKATMLPGPVNPWENDRER